MAKVKYYYDSESLTYKRIMPSRKNIFKNAFRYIFSSIALAFIFIIIGSYFFKSPQQKSMERELENMIFQYSQIDKKIEELELVLNNIEDRDNSIYRIYFEASPISSDKKKSRYRWYKIGIRNLMDMSIQT